MSPEDALIIVLQHELVEAQFTVEFLHGCLTEKAYKYAYPEQTLAKLERWKEMCPPPTYTCPHSGFTEECPGCIEHRTNAKKLKEAKDVLAASCGSGR